MDKNNDFNSHTTKSFTTTSLKKSLWKSQPMYKTVEKSLQSWKRVVVCVDDNHFFAVSVGVCEGLYSSENDQ